MENNLFILQMKYRDLLYVPEGETPEQRAERLQKLEDLRKQILALTK